MQDILIVLLVYITSNFIMIHIVYYLMNQYMVYARFMINIKSKNNFSFQILKGHAVKSKKSSFLEQQNKIYL